ncbi:M12 family metallo-peptidase [Marivirga salinae]|uniref:M12 family metallo-peptidase n=1 Tax=Marivirga salinarum TaxID=3059078 RepID=A0AA51NAA4_9BACT|nr:zinc-dependent metalloprotease family protein [Marivirga sp. BDSF4-3]WMN11240.1 M12 family metallo-peptidase [Marivirga sp. BDSF4-3]
MKKLLPILLLLPFIFATINLIAQKQSSWTTISVENSERLIPVKKQKDFNLKVEDIKSYLKQSKESQLSIPYPDGKFKNFNLKESQIMEPALAAKFPNIKTYVGRNPETGDNIRISFGRDGFHAMVFSKEGVFFIDPVSKRDKIKHQVYYKKDLNEDLINKNFYEEEPIIADKQKFAEVQRIVESGMVERPSGTELRTYRIAVATTGEYTQFHGGTVEGALSAIVATLNRVNGIYERDIAVTMILVDNNDQLIYTNPDTDPFTNNNANTFIDEVQADITNIIGSSNFDIGHGFSTGAGGLASLGSVCVDSRKASGVTGRSEPIGDPYDVDYVAHEIGHQFGAPHTFNGVVGSCAGGNRTASSAYEPGSGTTIMAYAGICGSDNIQNNSDPYFHAASLDYMTVFSQDNDGNSCAATTSTGNNLPTVEAGQGGYTIPMNTPFQLNGSASDPDGDGLSYTWEQYDLGPAGSPNSPEENAPLFRSFEPTTDSFRIFPQLSDILNGTQTQGELLPSYARDLNFRLTVRDDQAIAAVNYDDVSLSVTDQAGPFVVEEFTGDYVGLSTITVNWQVNNTDIAPVNAEFVDIYVSTDGGISFTEQVAANTANDGSQVITLPNVNTSSAKIKVTASNNIFFNISSGVFSISETTEPTYTIAISQDLESYCPSDEVTFTIESESILGYSEPIELNIQSLNDFTATFDNPTINPGESTILRLTNDTQASGTFNLKLNTNSGSISRSAELPFTVTNIPVEPNILFPADGSTDISLSPTLTWDDNNIESTYNIDIATDLQFTNIIESGSSNEKEYSIQNRLEVSSLFYARINTDNNCGLSGYKTISFTTAEITCGNYVSSDLPVTISDGGPNTIQSKINIYANGTIEGIEIKNISGKHTYISDLSFRLVSPSGTEVVLLSNICTNEDDFNFSISDDVENDNFPCPPVDGGIYLPKSPLSAFMGENVTGEWTLYIDDGFNQDGGELQNWSLDLCIGNLSEPELTKPTGLTSVENNDATITINWTDNSENEGGFIIERSKETNTDFIKIGTSDRNTSSFIDNNNLSNNTNYYYRVKSSLGQYSSNYSDSTNILFEGPQINPPNNLIAQENELGKINLTWTDNSNNETKFIIERSFNDETNFIEIGNTEADVNSFGDNTIEGDTKYYYRVKALFNDFSSIYSNSINIITQKQTPNAPSNITATNNEDGSVLIQWSDNAEIETGYIIERSTDDNSNFGILEELEINSTSFTDNAVAAETTYFYRVKAFNGKGESGYSEEAEIKTLISFPEAPTNLEIRIENDYTAILTWVDNATNETAYLVERSVGTDAFEQIAELAPDTEEYEEVVEIGEYTYRVLATNNRGDSDFSNKVLIDDKVLNTIEALHSKILMYPNPAKEIVYIRNESNVQFNKVVIRNTLGQLIKSEINIDNHRQIEIPVQSLAKGLYLIQIESNEGNLVKRLIIE